MSTTLAVPSGLGADIEKVVIGGDLMPLTPEQRVRYYHAICESLGLNPLTKPFAYIVLNNKLQLYALKDCTEQLRKIHGVSITNVDPRQVGDLFVVVAAASDKEGRVDSATGAVNMNGLKGEALANAMMKCETKAKRRVTLSICGLGMLDETEVDTLRQQGVASEPQGNNWPEPKKQTYTGPKDGPTPAAEPTSAISHPTEPDIRPRSQKGSQTPIQAPSAAPEPNVGQRQAVQGEVVGSEAVITEKQRKMFFAISRSCNLSDDQVKAALAGIGIHCHRDSIPKSRFQDALNAIDPQQKFHTNK